MICYLSEQLTYLLFTLTISYVYALIISTLILQLLWANKCAPPPSHSISWNPVSRYSQCFCLLGCGQPCWYCGLILSSTAQLVHQYIGRAMSRRHFHLCPPHPPAQALFLSPLPWCSLSYEFHIIVSPRAKHSIVIFFLELGQVMSLYSFLI